MPGEPMEPIPGQVPQSEVVKPAMTQPTEGSPVPATPERDRGAQPIEVVVGDSNFISEELGMKFDWFKRHPEYNFVGYASQYYLSETWFPFGTDVQHKQKLDPKTGEYKSVAVVSTYAGKRPDQKFIDDFEAKRIGSVELTSQPHHESTVMKFSQEGEEEKRLFYKINSEVSVPLVPEGKRAQRKMYTPDRVNKIRELVEAHGVNAQISEFEDGSSQLTIDTGGNNLVVVDLGISDPQKYDRFLRRKIFELEDSTDDINRYLASHFKETRAKIADGSEKFDAAVVYVRMVPKDQSEGFEYGNQADLGNNLSIYAKAYGAFLNAFYAEAGIQAPSTKIELKGHEFTPPKYSPGALIA